MCSQSRLGDLFERGIGGGLLGSLLGRAGALAKALVADEDADGKDLVVVRAGFALHLIGRREAVTLLSQFLEFAFGIHPGAGFEDPGQARDDCPKIEVGNRVVALIQIYSANDGLNGVGGNEGVRAGVALGFAAAEFKIGRNLELFGDSGERFGFYERRAPVGEVAFRIGVMAVEMVGNDELEYGVAQELQAFVVLEAEFGVLVEVTAMNEGALEQLRIVKGNAQPGLKFGKLGLIIHGSRLPGWYQAPDGGGGGDADGAEWWRRAW